VDTENRVILQHISATLDEMLVVLKTQPSRFERLASTGAAIVGTITIVSVIETILNWIFGG